MMPFLPLVSRPLTSNDICSASSERVSSVPLPFKDKARLIFFIPNLVIPRQIH